MPENQTGHRLHIGLPHDTYECLRQRAFEERVSLAEVVRRALGEYLRRARKQGDSSSQLEGRLPAHEPRGLWVPDYVVRWLEARAEKQNGECEARRNRGEVVPNDAPGGITRRIIAAAEPDTGGTSISGLAQEDVVEATDRMRSVSQGKQDARVWEFIAKVLRSHVGAQKDDSGADSCGKKSSVEDDAGTENAEECE